MGDDQMTAGEAAQLLAAMAPGALQVMEIRDGRLADAAAPELAVVTVDDPRAHLKPDGTWFSVIFCRGMDGPTREANSAAFAAVKRALASVVALSARIEALEESAEMACITPADDCQCAGCLTARDHYAAESEAAQ